MNPLLLTPTTETPLVDFNAASGILKLEGRSWAEGISQFYLPLVDWFDEYLNYAKSETHFHISLEYFNSTSSKMIYKLFMQLTKIADKGSKVIIHWRYQSNDEEMLEAGKEYRSAIKYSSELYEFKFISVED